MTNLPIPVTAPEAGARQSIAPEIQARVDHIMQELTNNPAIDCPITFNWHGNQKLADRASMQIRLFGLFMREARPGISFKLLKAITFHHDYERALHEAVGAERDAPAPSKEAGGLSVGMMVPTGDGVHLVMHESVALGLASTESKDSDWAQHIVRHELAHVDDFAFKQGLRAAYPDRVYFVGYDSYFAPAAEALWDEFYANKYAFGAWSDPRTFLDLLRDTLPTIRDQIIAATLEYRTHADLSVLQTLYVPKVKFVAQCFGYAAGTLAAMGTTLADEAPAEQEMLAKFGLVDAWDKCFSALQALDAKRPRWDSALELRELFPGCLALFAGFGFEYRPHGEGAFINVPFRPETDPDGVGAANA